MWKEGSIKVNGDIFHYWMKQYDKGSEWGIDGGRISKLMLKRDGKIVCNYDRSGTLSPPMKTHSLRWSFCSTARTGKPQQLKATAPKGAAARCTEGRTDFGGGYFLYPGGGLYEKTENI